MVIYMILLTLCVLVEIVEYVNNTSSETKNRIKRIEHYRNEL